MKAAYQGIPGSFGEQAMMSYFGSEADALPMDSFEGVFEAAACGKAEFGILPIENSSTGSINDVLDLLVKYDCYVCGEILIRVNHGLLGVKGALIDDITEVYSHPQGFLQCSEFLKQYGGWVRIAYINTAYSAKHVSEMNDRSKAAIAEKRNAEIYGLDVLNENINNSKVNFTRFIVISNKLKVTDDADKTSLAFTLKHRSGALFEAIGIFAGENINLLKIESRPIADVNFEYMFYVDFAGNISEEQVMRALEKMRASVEWFRLIGCYKAASQPA